MIRTWTSASAAAILAAAIVAFPGAAFAQYPDRPIHIVTTSGPGGIETLIRLIEPVLTEELGQPLVIDNQPGANGVIAVQQVMAAEPDGYTILFGTISVLAINQFVYQDIPYDTLEDLEPIALHGLLPMVWAAHPGKGLTNMVDLVEYARANPGELSMGNPGIGSFGHLLQAALLQKQDIDALIVPFRSAPQARNDAAAGFVDVVVDNVSNLSAEITDGRLTALGVTTRERSAFLPDTPSWLDENVGPFETAAWYAFMAPKGTPPEIITRLNAAIDLGMKSEAARERMAQLGATYTPRTPEEVREFIQTEIDNYRQVVEDADISVD